MLVSHPDCLQRHSRSAKAVSVHSEYCQRGSCGGGIKKTRQNAIKSETRVTGEIEVPEERRPQVSCTGADGGRSAGQVPPSVVREFMSSQVQVRSRKVIPR